MLEELLERRRRRAQRTRSSVLDLGGARLMFVMCLLCV